MQSSLFSPSFIMLLVALLTGFILLRPSLIANPVWRATITPLASIIGSGFLVAGPILAYAADGYAVPAMAALCLLAYCYGAAIRHNIRHIEPIQGSLPRTFRSIEYISGLSLAFAYFISFAYYISLFSSFALRGIDIIDPNATRIMATVIIAGLGLLGILRGLRAFENLEAFAVAIKLALIAGLIVALGSLAVTGTGITPVFENHPTQFRILLGLVILVQGFETSRYLGAEYDTDTRIKTMRYAQLIASAIYIVFILLMMPYFTGFLPEEGGETEIISLLTPLGTLIAPMIIVAALASQLSAAVADLGGAGGLLNDTSRRRISLAVSYGATACASALIIWESSIMEIITYASKAFVLYYSLQSLLALLSAASKKQWFSSGLFLICMIIGVAVILFAEPVAA